MLPSLKGYWYLFPPAKRTLHDSKSRCGLLEVMGVSIEREGRLISIETRNSHKYL